MPVEERRRLALRQHVVATWDEEAADTLFELVAPSGHELATKQDLASLEDRLDRRFDDVDRRFDEIEHRFEGVEHRFEGLEHRFDGLEHRLTAVFERRISDAVTAQTRTLVFSQLGALVAIAALAFGLR